MSWQRELDELRERERMAREMGGPDKVQRQHDGGRLTVRERIDKLVDRGSFHEVGAIAGKADYDAELARRSAAQPAAGALRAPASGRANLWQSLGPDTVIDGQVIGAIGVSGATSADEDNELAGIGRASCRERVLPTV